MPSHRPIKPVPQLRLKTEMRGFHIGNRKRKRISRSTYIEGQSLIQPHFYRQIRRECSPIDEITFKSDTLCIDHLNIQDHSQNNKAFIKNLFHTY